VLGSISESVAGGSSHDVRLDFSKTKGVPRVGWIRTASKGNVRVSSTQEIINNNTLVSVERSPTRRATFLKNVNHRWMADTEKVRGESDYFINLSDRPVRVGFCQSDVPAFRCRYLSYTLGPLEQTAFRITPGKRYALIESSPGYSSAMVMRSVAGDRKVFEASTSITFGDVVSDKQQ
jgi:hypothetical protein